MLKPEHKSVEWMTGLVSNFCKVEELVVTICTGTFATAIACLQLPEDCRFIVCKKNSTYFLDVLPSLGEEYAKQVLSLDSVITEGHKVAGA